MGMMDRAHAKFVAIDIQPHRALFRLDLDDELWMTFDMNIVLAWCVERFGASHELGSEEWCRWTHWGTRICLYTADDAFEFRLAWC
jgi:hypothetical protein